MSEALFRSGCSIISYHKYGRDYGMTCAWSMMVDYDKVCILLGELSDTGAHLEKGDIIGISVLAKGQKEVALHFGEGHSIRQKKLENQNFTRDAGAILLEGAKHKMKAEVLDILHLKENPKDHLVYLQILKKESDEQLDFLALEDVK